MLENMWDQAKPLEERIHEIETGKPLQEITVIHGEDAIYDFTKELSAGAKDDICVIAAEMSPERAIKFGTFYTDMEKANSGIKIRYIYPITRDNIYLVKKIMEFAEVRHIEEVPIRVRIVDGKSFLLRHANEEHAPSKLCTFSQAPDFVLIMKAFFEKLWADAMPAEERIRQLESEMDKESLKRFADSEETQDMFPDSRLNKLI
jgi:hypothetical protein